MYITLEETLSQIYLLFGLLKSRRPHSKQNYLKECKSGRKQTSNRNIRKVYL